MNAIYSSFTNQRWKKNSHRFASSRSLVRMFDNVLTHVPVSTAHSNGTEEPPQNKASMPFMKKGFTHQQPLSHPHPRPVLWSATEDYWENPNPAWKYWATRAKWELPISLHVSQPQRTVKGLQIAQGSRALLKRSLLLHTIAAAAFKPPELFISHPVRSLGIWIMF